MAPVADDLAGWLALDAARVPGRARALVRERGAGRLLDEGGLVLSDPPRRIAWDPRAARAAALPALRFLEQGGLALGGPADAELGRAAGRKRPPLFLYGRGDAGLLKRPRAVAVVGTREPTPVGLTRARRLAEELVDAGAVVVSGGARGVDRAAHEAAIEAGGETLFVLGQPVQADHDERRLWVREGCARAAGRTLAVTPFGPFVPHHRGLYAARNWTLAALADAVVVVEGAEGSGTRHTARAAHALGVPVFAWPTDAERPGAAMPNALIEAGRASPLPGDADAAARRILGGATRPIDARARAAPRPRTAVHPLLAALARTGGCLLVDEAARALAMPVGDLLAAAAELEVDGLLVRDGPALRLR
ncbi:MAG: DNA-processing protein DprA [Deltaproteobacteria bacterium]|nr:DNA-processing protein DprA [Deltaproteobacteria bacterium]